MDVALVVLWSVLILVGVGLIVVGVRLRQTDEVRAGVSGNTVALFGCFLVGGLGAALRQELAARS